MQLLLIAIGVTALVALGAYTNLTVKQARGVDTGATTIAVSGEGKVQAVPNIGEFSFTVTAEAKTATEAQQKSADSINSIMAYLKDQGVAEKDIKTQNYNLSPKYSYKQQVCPANSYCPPGDRVLDGYTASESIIVKVRKLDQASTLITGIGQKGATNISGLSFTVDDPTALQAQARTKAIADAKQKATELAQELGMTLGKVKNFSENNSLPYPVMYSTAKSEVAGLGGGGTTPDLPVGQNEIKSNVNITYELH